MKRIYHWPREQLYHMYVVEKKSTRQMAKELNCGATIIFERLRLESIPLRTINNGLKNIKDLKQRLYELYSIEHKTSTEIAKIFKCCRPTINNYLHKFGISINVKLIRERQSQMMRNKNPMKYKKSRDKISEANTGKRHTEKVKKKMSIIAIKSGSNKGKNNSHYGKPAYHGKRVYYKGICMKSLWEMKIAQLADQSGIEWLYEPKRFHFEDCSYLPDFYFPKWNLWIEVKGWMTNEAKRRINLFKKHYPEENLLVIEKPLYKKYIENRITL